MLLRVTCLIIGSLVLFAAQAQEKTLAVVADKPLMLSEISPTKAELADAAEAMSVSRQLALSRLRHNKFTEQLLALILDEYAQRREIKTDEALVNAFKSRFGEHLSTDKDTTRSADDIAKEQVRYWQIEKALYTEFGGAVIFTQQNPQYPIEAYRLLLEQYEQNGQLTFKSKEYESLLKRMFAPPYEMKIPSDQVLFEKPWWMTRQVIGGASSTSSNKAVEK